MFGYETDIFPSSAGNLSITFLGHGSLLLNFNSKNIYIDPYGEVADYSKLPQADIVLVTHEHFDHFDLNALKSIRGDQTEIVLTAICAKQLPGGLVMRNGESQVVGGIDILAVPAYNQVHLRDNGEPFHPRGVGNGYVMNFSDLRVYIAGDTENIAEMKSLQNITIAFLPMNLPYTMTPEMTAEAAKSFRPRILYPYHYGKTEVSELVAFLKTEKDIEVRVRKMA